MTADSRIWWHQVRIKLFCGSPFWKAEIHVTPLCSRSQPTNQGWEGRMKDEGSNIYNICTILCPGWSLSLAVLCALSLLIHSSFSEHSLRLLYPLVTWKCDHYRLWPKDALMKENKDIKRKPHCPQNETSFIYVDSRACHRIVWAPCPEDGGLPVCDCF